MKFRRPYAAFTLIELLTVIAIIGIMAALIAPSLSHFRKGDAMLSSTRQMLDATARARQLAISDHTTVYMVFVPPNFWDDTLYPNATPYSYLNASERNQATNLVNKQLTGYAFVSLRSVGDQPGRGTPRYLSQWQSLPESSFIAGWKFAPIAALNGYVKQIRNPVTTQVFPVWGFNVTTNVPFPSEAAVVSPGAGRYIHLPYIAFNYLGQLSTEDGQPLGRDVFIPLAHGSVLPAKGPDGNPILGPASALESPPGNSTNSFNLIHIDWLTGRARLERQEVK